MCTGITCTFDSSGSSDSDGTIASYSWSFGDGETSGAAAPSHDYPATGIYSVTLTVTDDAGATGSFSQDVSVVKPNVAPTAAYSVTCTYLDCTFVGSGSSDIDGTVDAYAWDFGGGATDTGVTVDHHFALPGDYAVALTVTDDDLATNTVTKTVTVSATA